MEGRTEIGEQGRKKTGKYPRFAKLWSGLCFNLIMIGSDRGDHQYLPLEPAQRINLTKATHPGCDRVDGFKAKPRLKIRLLSPNTILPCNKVAASGLRHGGSSWMFTPSPTPSRQLEVHHCSHPLVREGRHDSAIDYQPTERTAGVN